jgi:hypothetical protein
MAALLVWLEDTGLARAVREGRWTYPAVEAVHLLGIVLLFGAVALFDLRLLGVGRRLPVAELARVLLPAARLGFLIAVVAGVPLFAADATALAANPAFRLKGLAVLLAGVNAAAFHFVIGRALAHWVTTVPAGAKAAAAASLLLWGTAVVLGNLIPYAGE